MARRRCPTQLALPGATSRLLCKSTAVSGVHLHLQARGNGLEYPAAKACWRTDKAQVRLAVPGVWLATNMVAMPTLKPEGQVCCFVGVPVLCQGGGDACHGEWGSRLQVFIPPVLAAKDASFSYI